MTTTIARKGAGWLVAPALVAGVCSAPAPAAAFDYAESVAGDIASFDETNPTWIGTLDPGLNVISGSAALFAEGFDYDVFSVTVLPGAAIDSIQVSLGAFSGSPTARIKVFETPVYQPIHSFDTAIPGSYGIPGPPLAPGDYGFTTAFGVDAPPAGYEWTWFVTVPEPARGAEPAAAAALLAIARAAGATRRRRRARRGA